jgi:hypothetical protein
MEGVMNETPPGRARDPLVARAWELRDEVEVFNGRWPLVDAEPCLSFSWAALERQLVELAPTDLQAELVHRLVARTKAYARLKPAEMVLREVLCVAALVLDESAIEPADPAR